MKVTKEELYYTYRKVKRELFINKDTVYFDRIIDFEKNLEKNINSLYKILTSKVIDHKLIEIGTQFFTLKNIELKKDDFKKTCALFGSRIETLSDEIDYPKGYQPVIEKIKFRSFGDLSIEFQIIAGLWINKVGIKLEKLMTENSYGNRLKETSNEDNYKENHTYYKPYFNGYKNWQENLINHVKDINYSDEIIVINTDFENFFPSINLSQLQDIINKHVSEGKQLTNLLFELINEFNSRYECKGLPLNLLCSSSLANIYLLKFDEFITEKISPLYYGRYVDDILIALNANDELARLFINNESDYLGCFSKNIKNELDKFNLSFNEKKSKMFMLNKGDKDKFSQLYDHINKTSSEWRLIPSTEKYTDSSLSLNELFSDNYNTSHLIKLKETYSISTRRNYFIKEILNFEKTYFIINEKVWRERLICFFGIIENVIFDLENFVVFQKHIPRLIGLLVQTRDKELIDSFLNKVKRLLDFIFDQCNNDKNKMVSFIEHLERKSLEFISYFTPVSANNGRFIDYKDFFGSLWRDDLNYLKLRNKEYFNSDLHFEPLFNSFYKYDQYQGYLQCHNMSFLKKGLLLNKEEKEFISNNLKSNSCDKKLKDNNCECEDNTCKEIYDTIGFYFFTRRITLLELTVAFKNKIIDKEESKIFNDLASKFYSKINSQDIDVQTINLPPTDFNIKEITLSNPDKKNKGKVIICNTHFLTKDDSFIHTLQQLPEPDDSRTDRIINLINEILRSGEKIDYLVFHELSIPRNLYLRIAQNLAFANINLIAGIEYKTDTLVNTVDNQLVYVLKINDKFCESIALYQSKIIPAIHEESEIRARGGYSMDPNFKDKLLINHNEFFFSGMICNDLINIDNRSFLRGKIDLLFVVAWNTDTGMYEHLVKTTSFDNHCFVLLCNNRKYGDSHIFMPYSESYKRYLQRISGGKIDNFMISEVDLIDLRKFHINAISPKEPFKPVPTGFKMSENRKKSLKRLL